MSLPNFADPAISHRNHKKAVKRTTLQIQAEIEKTKDKTANRVLGIDNIPINDEALKQAKQIYNNKIRKLASQKEYFDTNKPVKETKYIPGTYSVWRKQIHNDELEIAKMIRENKTLTEQNIKEYAKNYITYLLKQNQQLEEQFADESNENKRIEIARKLAKNENMSWADYKELFMSFPIRYNKASNRTDIKKQKDQISGIQIEDLFNNKLALIFGNDNRNETAEEKEDNVVLENNKWKIYKLPDVEIVDYKIIDKEHIYLPIIIELKARYNANTSPPTSGTYYMEGKEAIFPYRDKEMLNKPDKHTGRMYKWVDTEESKERLAEAIDKWENDVMTAKPLKRKHYPGYALPYKKIREFEKFNGKNCYFVNFVIDENDKYRFIIGKYNNDWNDYPDYTGNEGEENKDIRDEEFDIMTNNIKTFGELSKY